MAELGRAPGGKVNLCQSRLPFSSLLLKVDKPPQLFSASDVKEITHWVNTVSIGYRAVGPITDCSSHTVYIEGGQVTKLKKYISFANLGSEKGGWVFGKLAGRLHKYSPFDVVTWWRVLWDGWKVGHQQQNGGDKRGRPFKGDRRIRTSASILNQFLFSSRSKVPF